MTDPQVREPGNALHDARDLLHTAGGRLLAELSELLPDHGFDAEQMHRWPPPEPVAPCGWVDVPTVTRAVEATGAQAVVSTFPVLFPVNGDDQAQVQLQDHLLSRGWDLFAEASANGRSVRVQTAGPADIDVGGAVLRGVVFSVQVRLLVRTLCPQRITSDTTTTNDEGTTP